MARESLLAKTDKTFAQLFRSTCASGISFAPDALLPAGSSIFALNLPVRKNIPFR
jgi:hypothetical protein